jgi:hypothetical protein
MNCCTSYYDLLGIAPGSNLQQVKKAFREKAKRYHPDINHNPFAQAHFIRIREAFEIIVRQKQSRNRTMQVSGKSQHFSKQHFNNPYHSSTGRNWAQSVRKEKTDFTQSRQGKIIYCVVHFMFILIGFLIFIDPLFIALHHQFDPFSPLYDSIFAAIVTMIFGIIMMTVISLSLATFIRETQISKMK